ncbi:MAG: sterol desaturase family protein [Polymorphobacter sp.]
MHLLLIFLTGALSMTLIVAVRYLIVSGAFAALTRALRPELAGPSARRQRQVRREIGWSLSAAAIYGVPAGLVAVAWQRFGATAIYSDPLAHGWIWLLLSVPVYLFVHDSYFYWTHRLMHRPRLFRRVHAVHHESNPPTAWAAMSFHPWESLSGALLVPLLVLVVPIHWAALAIVLAVMTFFGVTNHLGWEIFPRRWLEGSFGRIMITASHHHLHHRNYRSNFGLYFRFWDRVCGTDQGWAKELTHDPETAATRNPGVAAAVAGTSG